MIPSPMPARPPLIKGAPTFVVTPLDRKTIVASATTFDFLGTNFGPGPVDFRSILVCYANKGTGNQNDLVVGASSIGGKPAFKVCGNGYEVVGAGAIIADLRSPATNTVSLTFAKAQPGGCTIEVYALRNFAAGPILGPTSEISSPNFGATLTPSAIAVAKDALAMGVAALFNPTAAPIWAGGLTGISNAAAGDGTFTLMVGWMVEPTGANKSFSVTIGNNNMAKSLAVGSINT